MRFLLKTIVRGDTGDRIRGTGYLITRDLIATCNHVVPEGAADGPISVRLLDGTYEGSVIARDREHDCALVRLHRETNAGPLPLGTGCTEGEAFWSVGFPLTARQSRLPLSGHVVAAEWQDPGGAPAILLFSPQVAAGQGGLLQGFSGSPVLIAGVCVGHLKSIVPDAASADDRPYAQLGYVYACPSPRVAALGGPSAGLACPPRNTQVRHLSHGPRPSGSSPADSQPSSVPASRKTPVPAGPLMPAAKAWRWDFFIAHAEADTDHAVDLHDLLTGYGHRSYLDQKCLLPGDDWNVELPRAQRQALMTVVLLSSRCEPSYYQREEIAAAIALAASERYHHRVVPVHVTGGPDDAADIPYGLRSKQGLVAGALGGMAGIAQALDSLLGKLREREAEHEAT